jgi:hypothetical protein
MEACKHVLSNVLAVYESRKRSEQRYIRPRSRGGTNFDIVPNSQAQPQTFKYRRIVERRSVVSSRDSSIYSFGR